MEKNATLKVVSWKQVRDEVHKVNSPLAKIIDELDPDDSFRLYRAAYPYGCLVLDQGRFYLPNREGKVVPIDDPSLPTQVKEDLEYVGKGMPVGLILNRAMEIFVNVGNKTLPWQMSTQGSLFALWRKLDPYPLYHPNQLFSITSGARCIFMLPNIGDITMHKNLKRDYKVRQSPPKRLLDQWEIFTTIVHNPNAHCDWQSELLFFSARWIEKLKDDPSWRGLFSYLLSIIWNKTSYWRNQTFYNFALSCAQENRHLKPNPYLADTLKHLLAIATGSVVGFGVGTDDTCAPIKTIQNAYIESYGLKKYFPTLLHSTYFSGEYNYQPVYYSLQLPTTSEFSPKSRKLSSTLHDLSELKHIANVFIDETLRGRLKIEDTAIASVLENIQFDFFHNKLDEHGEIRLTKEIPERDPRFLHEFCNNGQREFAEASTFMRGCIQVSKSDQKRVIIDESENYT